MHKKIKDRLVFSPTQGTGVPYHAQFSYPAIEKIENFIDHQENKLHYQRKIVPINYLFCIFLFLNSLSLDWGY
jgi:hypothetical protein